MNKLVFFVFLTASLFIIVSCQNQDESSQILVITRANLANQLGINVNQISVSNITRRDWPDDCLGAAQPGEACAQIVTPGYEILLNAEGDTYEFRSTQDGGIIRLISPIMIAASYMEFANVVPETPSIRQVQNTKSNGVEVIGGDEISLREFISRWFAPMYPGALQDDIVIRIGALPQNLPYNLPLPEGTHVVASIQDAQIELQAILDVSQSPEQIKAFYEQALTESDWWLAPKSQHDGFSTSAEDWSTYCYVDGQAALMFQAIQLAEVTDLRLNLYTTDTKYMCSPPDQGSDQPFAMLLILVMPPQALMLGGSSGNSSNGTADISADIQSDLSAADARISGSLTRTSKIFAPQKPLSKIKETQTLDYGLNDD